MVVVAVLPTYPRPPLMKRSLNCFSHSYSWYFNGIISLWIHPTQAHKLLTVPPFIGLVFQKARSVDKLDSHLYYIFWHHYTNCRIFQYRLQCIMLPVEKCAAWFRELDDDLCTYNCTIYLRLDPLSSHIWFSWVAHGSAKDLFTVTT